MKEHTGFARWKIWAAALAAGATLGAGAAHAQTDTAAAPAAPTPPAAASPAAMPPPPAPAPMAPPPPMATPPSAVAAEVKPPTATEAMPATRPDVLPPIDVGAWIRAGGIFQGSDPSKVNDWHMDNAYVELHTGGKVTKNVGVTLNLNANMANYGTSTPGGAVALEDAIISFDFANEFHLWGGHLLVPVDRANASGPFFMIPWNYPGVAVGALPKEGPSGRNNGTVVWGDIEGGKFNYEAGVFDNGDIGVSPLYSARLRLALLDPEPGFWGNGSYFGDKDVLTIDVGGQVQAHGSSAAATATTAAVDKAYAEVNADVLLEKKIPGGGWGTFEGAYYHYNVLDGGLSDSLYVLAAYATPTIGVGNLQPMVRYQWAKVKSGTGTNPWNLDAGLSYLIKGPALRVLATYSHTRIGTDAAGDALTANSIQIGAQAIFF
ncbi:MAG TPA: hypothetical protein VFG23_00435 [Polyangia bacterium]|nr:hypothetical protein [Polyangia bacterium]